MRISDADICCAKFAPLNKIKCLAAFLRRSGYVRTLQMCNEDDESDNNDYDSYHRRDAVNLLRFRIILVCLSVIQAHDCNQYADHDSKDTSQHVSPSMSVRMMS